jgi:hypothetical protein
MILKQITSRRASNTQLQNCSSSIIKHASASSTLACKHLEHESCDNYLSFKWLHGTIGHLKINYLNKSFKRCEKKLR